MSTNFKIMSLGELTFLLQLVQDEDHTARAYDLGPAAIRRLSKAGYIAPFGKSFGAPFWILTHKFSDSEIQVMRRILDGSAEPA